MPAPQNLIHETSTTTGTGNFTLAAVNGKVRFSNSTYGFGTGGSNVFDYFISNQSAAEWERGTGHMSDANTLVRDTVVKSSNSDAAVNFGAGTKDVTNDIPAANQARLDAANSWSAAQTFINSSGIKIQDTDASHTLGLVAGSNLTGNRTLTVTTGDASRTLTISGDTTLGGGSHSGTNTGDQTLTAAATQAEQEAASSTSVYTSPGRQHFHPGVAKFYLKAGTAGNILNSYNITSVTDTGVGIITVTIATDFSDGNYTIAPLATDVDGGTQKRATITTQAAGSFVCKNQTSTGTNGDPNIDSGTAGWTFSGHGDHA
jgi:hypothetical protein